MNHQRAGTEWKPCGTHEREAHLGEAILKEVEMDVDPTLWMRGR